MSNQDNLVVEIFVSTGLRIKESCRLDLKDSCIKEDTANDCYYVKKSLYEANLLMYNDYIYLAIQYGTITNMSDVFKLGIFPEWSVKYDTLIILKHVYEENKEACDLLGVVILTEIKCVYTYVGPLYKSYDEQLRNVLAIMNK
jgi:hypothetical protein